MFDIIPNSLFLVGSLVAPVFGSYKALKADDSLQLRQWVVFWVVFTTAMTIESWFKWFLCWVPFYAWMRLFALLYIVVPQTQGAYIVYERYMLPTLDENETFIEDLTASAYVRIQSAIPSVFQMVLDLIRSQTSASTAPDAGAERPKAQSWLSDFYKMATGAMVHAAIASQAAPARVTITKKAVVETLDDGDDDDNYDDMSVDMDMDMELKSSMNARPRASARRQTGSQVWNDSGVFDIAEPTPPATPSPVPARKKKTYAASSTIGSRAVSWGASCHEGHHSNPAASRRKSGGSKRSVGY